MTQGGKNLTQSNIYEAFKIKPALNIPANLISKGHEDTHDILPFDQTLDHNFGKEIQRNNSTP